MLVIKQLSPRHLPMAWGFSLLTVQIVDDFSVRLVYLLIVELNIERSRVAIPLTMAQSLADNFLRNINARRYVGPASSGSVPYYILVKRLDFLLDQGSSFLLARFSSGNLLAFF